MPILSQDITTVAIETTKLTDWLNSGAHTAMPIISLQFLKARPALSLVVRDGTNAQLGAVLEAICKLAREQKQSRQSQLSVLQNAPRYEHISYNDTCFQGLQSPFKEAIKAGDWEKLTTLVRFSCKEDLPDRAFCRSVLADSPANAVAAAYLDYLQNWSKTLPLVCLFVSKRSYFRDKRHQGINEIKTSDEVSADVSNLIFQVLIKFGEALKPSRSHNRTRAAKKLPESRNCGLFSTKGGLKSIKENTNRIPADPLHQPQDVSIR